RAAARARVRVGRRLLVSRGTPLGLPPGILDASAVYGRVLDSAVLRRTPVRSGLLGKRSRALGPRSQVGQAQRARRVSGPRARTGTGTQQVVGSETLDAYHATSDKR